jgi:enoyl-[acyl-carrier protein] reductase III
MDDTFGLKGKRALVTGGSRGIGRAIAERLAAAGADVAINYLRRRNDAAQAEEAVRATGVRSLLVRGNVAEEEHVERIVGEVVAAWGGIDIVVSNAATGVLRPSLELTRKHWQVTIETNALALAALAHHAVPAMPAPPDGGRIVALSSLGSRRVIPEYGAVGASKAVLEAIVRQLAAEIAPRGITVNALLAGVVETEALDFFPSRDLIIEMTRTRTPCGRLVTTGEVADAALFLCSPLSRAVTGHTLVVDNGYSIIA